MPGHAEMGHDALDSVVIRARPGNGVSCEAEVSFHGVLVAYFSLRPGTSLGTYQVPLFVGVLRGRLVRSFGRGGRSGYLQHAAVNPASFVLCSLVARCAAEHSSLVGGSPGALGLAG